MRIRDLLPKECIELDLIGNDKQAVIRELIRLLASQNLVTDEEAFFRAVWEREQTVSTGIGMGIAIPHGKSNAVVKPAVAFGKAKTGVDFASLDGQPAYIFFLIAVPEAVSDLHLEVLSHLARKLMHEEVRNALMSAIQPEEVLAALAVNTG